MYDQDLDCAALNGARCQRLDMTKSWPKQANDWGHAAWPVMTHAHDTEPLLVAVKCQRATKWILNCDAREQTSIFKTVGKPGPRMPDAARGQTESPADVASEGAHPEEEKLTARGRNSPTEAKSCGQQRRTNRRRTESALVSEWGAKLHKKCV